MGTMGVAMLLTVVETGLVIAGMRSLRSLKEREKKYVVTLQRDFNGGELGNMKENAVSRLLELHCY